MGIDDFTPIDHSQDFEIRKTKDGRIFGIKNLHQEMNGNEVTYIADISGDLEAGKGYLKSYADSMRRLMNWA